MVFEGLTNPVKASRNPVRTMLIGASYASFAVLLGLSVFQDDASLVMIFLTALASIPLIYNAIKIEERKDLEGRKEFWLLKEHSKTLAFFMFLFIGFVIAYMAWYVLLPQEHLDTVFSTQIRDINRVRYEGYTVANAVNISGAFAKILLNNTKVLMFSLLFSFFYGFGAIFILSWNASIIGTAIGSYVRENLSGGIAAVIGLGLFRYLTHGIPEILAYFTAGLAGGIVSIAIVRHDFGGRQFRKVLMDSGNLVAISFGLLVMAALIEVFITPVFI